jgi:O-antigen ligase
MFDRLASILLLLFVASIPLDQVPVEHLGSASVPLGMAALFVGTLAVAYRRRLRRMTLVHLLLAAFVAWGVVSYVWTVDPDTCMTRIGTYLQLLALVLLLWQLARNPEDARTLAMAYVAGAAVASLSTAYAFKIGETADLYVERYAGVGYDPNDLGVTLALGLVFAWFGLTAESPWSKRLAIVYLPVALTGIALTASRGAMLTTIVAIGAVLASSQKASARRKVLVVLGAAIGAVIVGSVAPESTWERLGTIRDEVAVGTMTHRTEIWKAGVNVFATNPLVGVGAGGFASAVAPLLGIQMVAHNTVLGILTELGIVGGALFVGAWIVLIVRTGRVDPSLRPAVRGLIATWVVGTASLSWEYRKTTWFLIAFITHVVVSHARAGARSGCT